MGAYGNTAQASRSSQGMVSGVWWKGKRSPRCPVASHAIRVAGKSTTPQAWWPLAALLRL